VIALIEVPVAAVVIASFLLERSRRRKRPRAAAPRRPR
jgi:hypothetical protein